MYGSHQSSNEVYARVAVTSPPTTSSRPHEPSSVTSCPSVDPISDPSSRASGSTSATADQKIDSGPRPPAWSHTQTATTPPGRVTRAISPTPAAGSFMKCTTSCARAASNSSSANGIDSAGACRMSTSGSRSRTAATNGSEGSAPVTAAAPSRSTSTVVNAPGPQPTSSTRIPEPESTPAKSANGTDSFSENRPMNRW